MKFLTYALTLAAMLAIGLTAAGGDAPPQPGLEIFDVNGSQPIQPLEPIQPLPTTQPAPIMTEPMITPPYDAQQPGFVDSGAPFYQGDATSPIQQGGFIAQPPSQQPRLEALSAPQAAQETLDALAKDNPNYPGLSGAIANNDLNGASAIIWKTLRERRIIKAATERGPGGSAGVVTDSDLRILAQNIHPVNPDGTFTNDPMAAARRLDYFVDSFNDVIVQDYSFGQEMPAIITRIYLDLQTVRAGMEAEDRDAQFQELGRARIRALAVCDFFAKARSELLETGQWVMEYAPRAFYPDGSSIAGDVGGITGSIFLSTLSLYNYGATDQRFDRAIWNRLKVMDRPIRYLLDVAYPDGGLPAYGPRGNKNLDAMDTARLATMLQTPRTENQPLYLASSSSFPSRSGNKGVFGGLFVTRDKVGADSRYMAVRFGPAGAMSGATPHHDFGSLSLSHSNIRFIIDPGGSSGAAASAMTHNSLTLDGESPALDSYTQGGKFVDAEWRTNIAFDYAASIAPLSRGKTWERDVLYVKNMPGESLADYWFILDRVGTAGDNQPHNARLRFQMPPGMQAYNDGSGILATAGYGGPALRIFSIDPGADLLVSDGDIGNVASFVYDNFDVPSPAPAVTLTRPVVGDTDIGTVLFPAQNPDHRPARIDRDSDIIRRRTGAVVINHGQDWVDVIAWAPSGGQLVTPTLNLQLSADMAVFRLRKGQIVRAMFMNLSKVQAKDPQGGLWNIKLNGPGSTVLFERTRDAGWMVLSDPANKSTITLDDMQLGSVIVDRRVTLRPGEIRAIDR